MSNFDIYGIGAALVDTEIEVTNEDLSRFNIDKGIMSLVDETRQHELLELLSGHLCQSKRASGGSAANSIIAAQYFGASTYYSCKVADDDNGRFYLEDLKAAGVSSSSNSAKYQGITGKCLVMITDDAERTMNTFLGISESLSVDDINLDALKQSKYAYIEGYLVTSETGKPAAVRLRELAEENHVKTALSLSDPFIAEHFNQGIGEMIGKGVDILFCNEDEAMSYTKMDSVEEAETALKQFAKTFVITQGARGALIYDGENTISVPAPSVTAVDTNGAGDMFAGAFLYAITQGQSYRKAGELAVKAAAQVVSQFGPRLSPEQYDGLLNP